MNKILINGEEVIFGPVKQVCREGHYTFMEGREHYHVHKQRWDLPNLELHGYVFIDNRSVDEIKERIQREVTFDLEQREKRKLGIPTTKYSDCCR